jgi:hypothetical protein
MKIDDWPQMLERWNHRSIAVTTPPPVGAK